MADGLRVDVRIRNLDRIQRGFADMPGDARKELREGSRRIARALAAAARAAGKAEGPQAARAASTVRALAGSTPQVVAGPHPLLFGSEFGMTRRTGWYAAPRYYDSPRRQFRPHLGSGSYWFFTALAANTAAVQAEYKAIADAIVNRFPRG